MAVARWLERHDLALELLRQVPVRNWQAEAALTPMRRWLLLSGAWRDYPRAVDALVVQAGLSGGAWFFDDDERAALDAASEAIIAGAFRPHSRPAGEVAFDDPVTRGVATQYEAWPYPFWSRITRRPFAGTEGLPKAVRRHVSGATDVLVAGCGTGREPLFLARMFPEARILAVDLSARSLEIAKAGGAALGFTNITYAQADLHRIADADRRFDYIAASGVLHHLPDPEAGWRALAGALKPGGVMGIMVYSKIARLQVQSMRAAVADLLELPMTDDLLRLARARIASRFPDRFSPDFFTLSGIRDLLLHSHEDPFDIARIARGIADLDLEFLGFRIPQPRLEARYRANNPGDPHLTDFDGWVAVERAYPNAFAGMYKFWCRKR
jgi:SAM-dependent methyltransferase